MDTITASGQKFALATPYLLGQHSGGVPQDVTDIASLRALDEMAFMRIVDSPRSS